MFGPRNKDNETETQETGSHTSSPAKAASEATPRVASPATPRGVVNMGRRSSGSGDEKKLIVGKGLSLAGEITSCDILVVEGKVEAKLTEGKMIEITEAGQFRGSVEIENADIAGRYDGQLVVHGRLTVRSTGRISGQVKYGELEVSAGGQIIGEVQVTGGGTQASNAPSFKSAARFAALTTEEDQDEQRKSA